MPVWRARHWEGALRGQGVEDVGMAAKMQQRFDAARIELFQFEPGVKVCRLSSADLSLLGSTFPA